MSGRDLGNVVGRAVYGGYVGKGDIGGYYSCALRCAW